MLIRKNDMTQAWQCPECFSEGYTSLENQEITLEHNKEHGHYIRIENSFFCMYCSQSWSQTITAKVGDVLSNTLD